MWTATTGHKCLFKNNSRNYESTSTTKVDVLFKFS